MSASRLTINLNLKLAAMQNTTFNIMLEEANVVKDAQQSQHWGRRCCICGHGLRYGNL